jgi:hypothetical protein
MRAAFLQAIDNCNNKFSWWCGALVLRWVLVILAFVAWSLVMFRAGGAQAEKRYEAWKVRFADDYISQMEAAERGMPPDPRELLAEQEITAIAKVLYGVEVNTDADLHKYCWAIFNRVDNKAGEFADVTSIEDVISKPSQFVGYNPDYADNYPVLDRLKQIAREEYVTWKNGSRPYDVTYCFIYWTPDKILLMKDFNDWIHGV